MDSRHEYVGWRTILVTLAVLAGSLRSPLPTAADALSHDEYAVKAAMLYNMTKFVEWPPGSFADPTTPITLCILGADPFHAAFHSRSVRGRAMITRSLTALTNLQDCHVLFIREAEQARLPQIFERLKGVPVLTVGERPQFVHTGGIINFVMHENKLRFEVNLNAAQQARLKLSAQLLKLGHIVEGHPPGGQP